MLFACLKSFNGYTIEFSMDCKLLHVTYTPFSSLASTFSFIPYSSSGLTFESLPLGCLPISFSGGLEPSSELHGTQCFPEHST